VIDEIVKLLKQLSQDELKNLYKEIEADHGLGSLLPNKKRRRNMQREDIEAKVKFLLLKSFAWIEHTELDDTLEKNLGLDAVNVTDFAETLIKEFDLEGIEFSKLMEWQAVGDIVDYIENCLECASHNVDEPYINGFEPEA